MHRLLAADIFLSLSGSTALTAASGKAFAVPVRLLVELPSYRIVALGEEARAVEHAGIGRSRVIVPCDEVEVFDERGAEVFLRGLFRIVLGSGFLLKPKVWLALPGRTTPFMQEVWLKVILAAGARDVVLVNPLLAIAAGAGLPLDSAHGYAVGSITDKGVVLGLVAFSHVQQEVWQPVESSSAEVADVSLTALSQAWQKLLPQVPVEFASSLQREGAVLVVPEDSAEWSQAYTNVLGVPVSTFERTTAVLGLRALAKEENA